ncbi:MAG: hypothetical protein GXP10_05970 [Gammaproteobacteria bacterium]|nr:hypothetical protein [Gammaproteobacteria bacterium]
MNKPEATILAFTLLCLSATAHAQSEEPPPPTIDGLTETLDWLSSQMKSQGALSPPYIKGLEQSVLYSLSWHPSRPCKVLIVQHMSRPGGDSKGRGYFSQDRQYYFNLAQIKSVKKRRSTGSDKLRSIIVKTLSNNVKVTKTSSYMNKDNTTERFNSRSLKLLFTTDKIADKAHHELLQAASICKSLHPS